MNHNLQKEIQGAQDHGRQKHNRTVEGDNHTDGEWASYIADHNERARLSPPMDRRQHLIKVAGLAVSAIEQIDRGVPRPEDPAVTALRELIRKEHPDKQGVDVSVFVCGDNRISEISVSWITPGGMAGFACMESEPACFGTLFAAERFLLYHGTPPYRPEGWDTDLDLAAEAEEAFLYLYRKKP